MLVARNLRVDSHAVSQCVGLAEKKLLGPCEALFLRDCTAWKSLLVGDAHRCVEAGFLAMRLASRPGVIYTTF